MLLIKTSLGRDTEEEVKGQRRWQQVKYVQSSPCERVAGRINNKGFRWKKGGRREKGKRRRREKEKERQGDSPGLMFICGFISFTVWSSFTVRIISLSRSHIPPLRPRPRPSRSTLPVPSMAIKILSATLLKNYRASPFIRILVLLEKILLTHAN